MRKIATTAATALVLALAPLSSAAAQTPAGTADAHPPAAAVLAQENQDEGGGNGGLWGLLGLLGLLGLIPRRQKERSTADYRTRNTGM
ncbi:MAG TPA: WGxxGxxG family protein [Streptomyces sp.]|uniref:WGxxGxxG family protein n=1 Tax=Streptomyces sp. TaxID=1931 RepID=UPI002D56760C|nr:WGxxGxxG family protein [Streptomyces sp.]HZG02275.1 WGxxGxxG family protein [Streptomyces sp.]